LGIFLKLPACTGKIQVDIFDTNGMKQKHIQRDAEATSSYDLGQLNLSTGLYILKVRNEGRTLTTKLLIQ